jgi:hypothetical protein
MGVFSFMPCCSVSSWGHDWQQEEGSVNDHTGDVKLENLLVPTHSEDLHIAIARVPTSSLLLQNGQCLLYQETDAQAWWRV